jgi:hypothetical protein
MTNRDFLAAKIIICINPYDANVYHLLTIHSVTVSAKRSEHTV